MLGDTSGGESPCNWDMVWTTFPKSRGFESPNSNPGIGVRLEVNVALRGTPQWQAGGILAAGSPRIPGRGLVGVPLRSTPGVILQDSGVEGGGERAILQD